MIELVDIADYAAKGLGAGIGAYLGVEIMKVAIETVSDGLLKLLEKLESKGNKEDES